MLINVYLQRAHKDPNDTTGKAVLLAGHLCALPEVEAEDWINKGWANPVDAEAFHAHLEAKIADPVKYQDKQAQDELEAKAKAMEACAKRKEDRPNLAQLSKRKGELRAKCAAEQAAEDKAAKARAAVAAAKTIASKGGAGGAGGKGGGGGGE